MKRFALYLLLATLFTGIPAAASAQTGFTQQDRELLIKLNVKVEEMEKRFTERFEQVDKRFEQVDKHFSSITIIMAAIIAAFAGIVGANIAIVVWDRRSMTRPFEEKTKKMEDEILENKERIASLIKALRELAPHDQKLAEVLRSFSLL